MGLGIVFWTGFADSIRKELECCAKSDEIVPFVFFLAFCILFHSSMRWCSVWDHGQKKWVLEFHRFQVFEPKSLLKFHATAKFHYVETVKVVRSISEITPRIAVPYDFQIAWKWFSNEGKGNDEFNLRTCSFSFHFLCPKWASLFRMSTENHFGRI